MDKLLRIALLQLLPGENLEKNLQIGMDACRKAKQQGADIALFPEMWSCGYQIPEDPDDLRQLAISADEPFVNSFGRLAKELDMAICITLLEAFDPLPRNTAVLFDRHGSRVMTYAKVHTCDFGEEIRLTPGEDFFTAPLDTEKGTVAAGIMICYDREFPESARILMLQGAELVLVPNACPMEINRLSQLRARTFENMMAIATCNYPEGQPDCNGHSSLFDGVAYLPDLKGSRDTCLLEAGSEPGIFYGDLDLSMLRRYRSYEVHGNAFRRPEKYGILLDNQIQPPFIRHDRRK